MTDFEKKIIKDLEECDNFIDAIEFLQENDYELDGQDDEAGTPAKLEIYFTYEGEEEVSGDGSLDLYIFTSEDIYKMYEDEDSDDYDMFIENFNNEDWYEIEEYITCYIPSMCRDNKITYPGVPEEEVKKLMFAYDNWTQNQ